MKRRREVERKTKETSIRIDLDLDGTGTTEVETGIPFFDHMLEQIGRHGKIDLSIRADGDLEVDAHHTVEDVGIALGEALVSALGDKAGIRRFGHALIPLDESLSECALDLSGRPYLDYRVEAGNELIGTFPPQLAEEFMRAFITSAGISMHLELRRGKNPHHILESAFKAVGRALGDAVYEDPRLGGDLPSTKGKL